VQLTAAPSLRERRNSDAKRPIQSMLDARLLHADQNTLFMLILFDGVSSRFDGDGSMSCSSFCGYHADVAYAILTSSTGCQGCGNGEIGSGRRSGERGP
jgi:hypothetical protein